ncbi:DUF6345 domain-containing protein [Gloeobacter morelensis]|uniref:DUF6345 domain-containing protein n=1 Tax=Gloeobacter morelensis TaxID=2907343 RepID=UPI001E28C889|nr:DUF6345 domain-containing protein [Gloeobacter morelensis]
MAFESDWNADDDSFVDAADIVFYAGHASPDGWVLNAPGDTFLHFSEVGASPESPGDLWGNTDVEWIVIAACGPLQDDSLNGGGNVFDRWRGVFDGLHSLMGYAAVTYDNTEEGRKFVQYAKGGYPLIDAWFRAAQEVQPSTNADATFPGGWPAPNGPNIFAAAIYGYNSVYDDPRYDYLWGYGPVAFDSPGATNRWIVWTGT